MIREINVISSGFREVLERNNVRGFALSLEFNTLSKVIKTNAEFSVSDINTNMFAIQLLNNGSPIVIEESSILYVNVERADGTIVTNKCEVIDGEIGAILIKFSKLSNEIVGTNRLEVVVIHTNNEKIVSPRVSYKTFQSIDSYYEYPDQESVDVLDILVDEVVSLKNSVINTNSTLEQEMAERQLVYAQINEAEQLRISNELKRQESHESIKATEELITMKEETREENMNSMILTFGRCMEAFESKVQDVNSKIAEYDSNEESRKNDHSDRVTYFDEVIKVDHQNILKTEELREQAESQRSDAEIERNDFFNEAKHQIETWEDQEETRVSQEASRVNSFKNMTSTFDSKVQIVDGKISAISEKISEATQKITQFSNDEATRKSEHSARVNKFDNEIVVKHQEMVSEENKRVTQESARVIAENERKNFYAQTQTAEASRVTADEKREEKVRALEARVDSKINETSNHVRTLEARVNEKIDETDAHVTTLEDRVNAKINEYNTATLITNAEIDTIIANALK